MATTTKHTVTIPMQVDRDELLNNVMGSAWETWSWWKEYEYADGYDWDTYPDDPHAPYVTVTVDDPDHDWWSGEEETDSPSRTRTLSVDDLLTAVGTVLTKHPHVRWDDMDAISADIVLQYATIGAYTYA